MRVINEISIYKSEYQLNKCLILNFSIMKRNYLKGLFFVFAAFALVACGGDDAVTDDGGNGDGDGSVLSRRRNRKSYIHK